VVVSVPERLTPDQRTEWRLLADAATEGPWTTDPVFAGLTISGVFVGGDGIANADLSFIASARLAVPALDNEVTRLTAEVAALQAVIARLIEHSPFHREDRFPSALEFFRAVDTAPGDALDAMLRKAGAGELRTAADLLFVPDPGGVSDEFLRGLDHGADTAMAWLRRRADEIEAAE
jgi:hypothetical protein